VKGPDSPAVRKRRERLHKAGDHTTCRPEWCPDAPKPAESETMKVASTAVERFLADFEPKGENDVLVTTARLLAAKLDACASSDTAAAAQAMPRIAAELFEVLDRLRWAVPHEPDTIEQLAMQRQARMNARRIVQSVPRNGGAA
jgi:hypothetical protein